MITRISLHLTALLPNDRYLLSLLGSSSTNRKKRRGGAGPYRLRGSTDRKEPKRRSSRGFCASDLKAPKSALSAHFRNAYGLRSAGAT
jgi:hypothetical protein